MLLVLPFNKLENAPNPSVFCKGSCTQLVSLGFISVILNRVLVIYARCLLLFALFLGKLDRSYIDYIDYDLFDPHWACQ